MINELLTTLMEDTQFVDIMTADILDEGLFDKFKKKKEEPKPKQKIDPKTRSKILSDVVSIFKKELKILKSKYPIKNSIYMTYVDEIYKEDKNDFIDGNKKYLRIADYDLWKFNENARNDDDADNEFWKYANELINNVNKQISKYDAKINADGGDWDTGSFDLEIN